MSALRELTLLRIRSFIREPESLFWTFGFPILMTLGLGLAFREPAGTPRIPIALEAGSIAIEHLDALDGNASVEPAIVDSLSAERALRRGEVPLVLGGRDSLVMRFDPARPESREARLLVDAVIQTAAGATRPVPVVADAERLPGSRYIDWLVPGLIGLNLMSTGMWGIGFGLVYMRQKKQLKRLIATPMRRSDFLLAQILARVSFLVVEIPPIVLFAWLVFDVEVAGSILLLTAVVLLGALTFAGIGLLASARAKTIEGVSGVINVIMLPMFVLSGIFFSSSRFPDAMQPFIRALPLTALNDAMRVIYNEGLGVAAILGEVGVLTVWCIGSFALALRYFRWQ